MVLDDGTTVTEAMLPESIRGGSAASLSSGGATEQRPAAISPYREQERGIIEAALVAFGGNIARAAAALEISPATIYRKRQAWSALRPIRP